MKLATGLKVVFVIFAIPVSLLILANLWDEELSPKARKFTEPVSNVSPRALEGFQYYLAIAVPTDQDPVARGREIYEKAKAAQDAPDAMSRPLYSETDTSLEIPIFKLCEGKLFCTRDQFNTEKDAIDDLMKVSKPALKRYDRLIAHGSFESDLSPVFNAKVQITRLLRLNKLKILQWNTMLRNGQYQTVLAEIGLVNSFLANSLTPNKSLMGLMVILLNLNSNREFIISAAEEFPELKRNMTSRVRQSFVLSQNFEQLYNFAIQTEGRFLDSVLDRPISYSDLNVSTELSLTPSGVSDRVNEWSKYLIKPLLKKNRTLNDYAMATEALRTQKCITDSVNSCTSSDLNAPAPVEYVVNPVGKFIVNLYTRQLALGVRKLYHNIQKLSQPLEFKISPTKS